MNFYFIIFLIQDLRKESSDQNTIDLENGVIGYKFHNVTKYYENDLVFLSHESKHINMVPLELLGRVEGVIVYFDSDNVSYLYRNEIIFPSIVHFLNVFFSPILFYRKIFCPSCQFMRISSNRITLNLAFCCAANCTIIHWMELHTKKAKNSAMFWTWWNWIDDVTTMMMNNVPLIAITIHWAMMKCCKQFVQ